MTNDLSGKTVCVIDDRLFVEVAIRLSRDFGKVYYFSPWETGFSTINDALVGDGFENIQRVNDLTTIWDEVDLWVFPDAAHAYLQLLIEKSGGRVWGSRNGQKLEQERIFFRHLQESLGMAVPGYKICRGVDALRDYLQDSEDKFVKLSRYRGTMETWHHINWILSESRVDELVFRLGNAKNHVSFLVDDAIHTDLEDGWDGYSVDGQFPDTAVQGVEIKDKCYIGSVQKYSELPKELTEVNEMLSDTLKGFSYRNFFSSEVRIKDGVSYLTDPCCRQASPAGECMLELIGNLGEVMWHGAVGDLVQPEFTAKFAAEVMIHHEVDPEGWRQIQVPLEVRKWVKLYRVMEAEDCLCIVPSLPHIHEIGAVVGLGDTIKEAIDSVKDTVEALDGQPVKIDTRALFDALKEIHSAEEQGVEFSSTTVPEPEIVLQDA